MANSAREAALEALKRCRQTGTWSAVSVDMAITKYALDRRDAALATVICLGTLQNCTLCDFYIDSYCSSKHLEPLIRDILRTGVYQILFMDKIPDSAAVNEAVALTKKHGYKRASGLVNAVLRKISDNKNSLDEIPGRGSAAYLSIKYSHPEWLAEKIISQNGYDFAENFLKSNNIPAETCIQVNTNKTSQHELEARFENADIKYQKHEWLENCLTVQGNVTALPGFSDGLFYVQDPAAFLAVEAAELKPGMNVLDACAAPGGKSFAAAIAMKNCGKITSCDIHEKKIRLISEGAERLGLSIIHSETADARDAREEQYDAVIADVPCSGLGVIRKKPEIRNKTANEIAGLPKIQSDILSNLSNCVKPGGVLLYSTCTVIKEENEDVVNEFLSKNPSFSAEAFTIPHIGKVNSGMYTFWPNVDGTDGFFICKLRRSI